MEETTEKETENSENETESRQEYPGGPFKKGNIGGGRRKETQEEKEYKANRKEIRRIAIDRYIHELTEALKDISPILQKKALEGDIIAIKEINDRALGKAPQSTTIKGDSDNPVEINIINYANNNTLPIHPEDISDTDI